MRKPPRSTIYRIEDSGSTLDRPENYLTPEQRLDIVADILSTIALRIVQKHRNGHPENDL